LHTCSFLVWQDAGQHALVWIRGASVGPALNRFRAETHQTRIPVHPKRVHVNVFVLCLGNTVKSRMKCILSAFGRNCAIFPCLIRVRFDPARMSLQNSEGMR
jgi:hypothetical protein